MLYLVLVGILMRVGVFFFFFFFQAEDGIRDRNVTGVQTCALPIWGSAAWRWRIRRPAHPGRRYAAREADNSRRPSALRRRAPGRTGCPRTSATESRTVP